MNTFQFVSRLAVFTFATLILSACNMPPEDAEARVEYDEINDPFESTNRKIFEFNRGLDRVVFKPLARTYLYLPEDARQAIHNATLNLGGPVDFGNALFQGDRQGAGNALARLLINTTIGLGGLFDPASALGIPSVEEDFGQTLAVWGSKSGPYIVIPIFGPSNPRNIVGGAVDSYMDPLKYFIGSKDDFLDTYSLARGGAEGVDTRSRVMDVLDDIEENSLDFYATIRSLHRQHRNDQINNGNGSSTPGPSFMSEVDEDMEPSSVSVIR